MTSAQRVAIHTAMVRFADGNRSAFREVFDALWPMVLAFCASRLPIQADAEDAAQRALLKVFSQIADMDRKRDGVAWALTIAAYEIMTARRRSGRRKEQRDDRVAAIADARPPVDDQVALEETRDAVRTVLDGLSPRDQDALAAILNDSPVPPGEAARKRRYRALQRFRALWRNAK
jgi:RNA polymerase sigma-70 factor (ECF subfamily)